jgi:replication factor C large subunit
MTHHCKNRELTVRMAAEYDLNEKQISFITGSGEDTNKVQSVVEDAQELRAEAAVEHSGGAFEGAVRTTNDDAADGDDGDDEAQATLGGQSGGGADESDDADEPDEADDDQSGLDDFF